MYSLNAESEQVINSVVRGFAEDKLSKVVCTYEKFTNHYFFDPPMDTQMQVPYSDILNALLSMDNWGYLSVDESITTYCVECFAMGLNLVGRCPSCGSDKIKKGRVFSHRCGSEDFEELFRHGDGWTCPSCKKKLYTPGADYEDEGVKFKCVACSSVFDKYSTCYQCPECHANYQQGDEPSVDFKVYKPTEALIKNKANALNSFGLSDMIGRFLGKAGYEVRGAALQERAGDQIYWDVSARRIGTDPRTGVGVIVMPFPEAVTAEDSHHLQLKKRMSGFASMLVISPVAQERDLTTKLSSKSIYFLEAAVGTVPKETELERIIAPMLSK